MKNRNLLLLLSLALVACSGSAPTATATQAPQAPAASPAPSLTPPPTPVPSLTPAPQPAVQPGAGELFVDAGIKMGPISPLVYGSNYGPWLFVPLELRPAVKDARLTYIRWPGGNWGDQNDIEEYQVDEFIAFCRQIGAEPAISVRLLGGTPEKAAALVRYANLTKGYKVTWWSIGNEPNLFSNYDVKTYVVEWRKFAEAMRAVDPSIKLIGPDTSQFTYTFVANPPTDKSNGSAYNFLLEFLKADGDAVDLVAVHRYPFPRSTSSGPPGIDDLRQNSPEWDQTIPALRALIRQYTGRDLPVGVTEVNSSWAPNIGGEATMDSHYNAIWWGDSLGRMIRQGVDVVAQFDIIGQFGLLGNFRVYPSLHVYDMYRKFGEQRLLAVSGDSSVSVYAARRSDGAVTVMVINLGPDAASKKLSLAGLPGAALKETWLFDPAHAVEQVPSAALGDLISFPGQSMTLLVIAGK